MGMEQERNGGGGEWLGRRPGLRRLRVLGMGSLCSDEPERTSVRPLQGDGDDVSMETGVCICRKASRLGSSRWFSTCIWHLEEMRKKREEQKVIQLERNFLTSPGEEVIVSLRAISTRSPFQTPTLKPWQNTQRDSSPPFAISQANRGC